MSVEQKEMAEWLNKDLQPSSAQEAFDMEALAFVNYITPQPHEHLVKEWLIGRLRQLVHRLWNAPPQDIFDAISNGRYSDNMLEDKTRIWADLVPYGSFKNCSYSTFSDLDVCLVTNAPENKYVLIRQYSDYLVKQQVPVTRKLTNVFTSVVPQISFVDKQTEVMVQVSVNRKASYLSCRLMDYFLSHERFGGAIRGLLLILKYHLTHKGQMGTISGGLNSYSLAIMVCSYVQNSVLFRDNDLNPMHYLGELLIGFCKFYGTQFEYNRNGIALFKDKVQLDLSTVGEDESLTGCQFSLFVREQQEFDPSKTNDALLSILDPCDAKVDIGQDCTRFKEVSGVLKEAYEALNEALTESASNWKVDGEPVSYLSSILAAQNSQKKYRRRMLKLAEKLVQPGVYGIQPAQYNNAHTRALMKNPENGPPSDLYTSHLVDIPVNNASYVASLMVEAQNILENKMMYIKLCRGGDLADITQPHQKQSVQQESPSSQVGGKVDSKFRQRRSRAPYQKPASAQSSAQKKVSARDEFNDVPVHQYTLPDTTGFMFKPKVEVFRQPPEEVPVFRAPQSDPLPGFVRPFREQQPVFRAPQQPGVFSFQEPDTHQYHDRRLDRFEDISQDRVQTYQARGDNRQDYYDRPSEQSYQDRQQFDDGRYLQKPSEQYYQDRQYDYQQPYVFRGPSTGEAVYVHPSRQAPVFSGQFQQPPPQPFRGPPQEHYHDEYYEEEQQEQEYQRKY